MQARSQGARQPRFHLDNVLAQLDTWLPGIRRMHPDQPLGDVVRVLNRRYAARWSVERLRGTISWLIAEGILEANLLDRAPPRARRR